MKKIIKLFSLITLMNFACQVQAIDKIQTVESLQTSFPLWSDFESTDEFEANYQRYEQQCIKDIEPNDISACLVAAGLWDRELNIYYKKLKLLLPKELQTALKKSQLQWLAARDSSIMLNKELSAKNTHSPLTMAQDVDKSLGHMIKQRTILLRHWYERQQQTGSEATVLYTSPSEHETSVLMAWTQLANLSRYSKAQWGKHGMQSGDFNCATILDYGLRYLYCSIRGAVSLQGLQSLAGVKLYDAGGPHNDILNLNNNDKFGHYNSEFLTWLEDNIIPNTSQDKSLNRVTRSVYNHYFKSYARIFYRSYQILFSSPEQFDIFEKSFVTYKIGHGEYKEYVGVSHIKSFETIKSDYQERLRLGAKFVGHLLIADFLWLEDYMRSEMGDTDEVKATTTVGGFWVRRAMDGTAEQLFRMLTNVMRTFDPEFVNTQATFQK